MVHGNESYVQHNPGPFVRLGNHLPNNRFLRCNKPMNRFPGYCRCLKESDTHFVFGRNCDYLLVQTQFFDNLLLVH